MYSQTSIKGYVVDLTQKDSLAFASIWISNTGYGTVSNEEGYFELKIPTELSKYLLKISYVGYRTFEKSIDSILKSSESTFKLEQNPQVLSEVTVSAKSKLENPRDIVKKAIDNIPHVFNESPHILKGFFRQVHKEDDDYRRIIEAAISILDPGISRPNLERRINVDHLRRSIDKRQVNNARIWNLVESDNSKIKKDAKKWSTSNSENSQRPDELAKRESKYLSFMNFISKDLARAYNTVNDDEDFGILNSAFLKQHKFKFDTITFFDDREVYVIKILPSRSSKKYFLTPRNEIVPVGKLFIRSSDFAIVQMSYNYILNPKKRGTFDYELHKKLYGTGIIFSIDLQYKEFNNKFYLSSLKVSQPDPLAIGGQTEKRRNSGFTKGYFFVTRTWITTEIIELSSENIARYNDLNWNDNIYTEQYTFDGAFWKNQNILEETEKQKLLIKDLEGVVSSDKD